MAAPKGVTGEKANAAYYPDRIRRMAVEQRLTYGATISSIAEAVGCDPRTVYRWIAWYRSEYYITKTN